MRPRKRFGQHFLRDEGVLRRIADAMEIRADDEILEIGPGDGALTAELLRRGGRVWAVEIDRDLCAKLRVRFAEEARAGRLRLTEGDALREDFSEWEKDGGTRVAGNFPYNISTPLLLRLTGMNPRDIHAMVQLEVAERLRSPPGDSEYGRLTATVGMSYETELLFRVAPESFDPPPRVESAVIRLTPGARESVPDNLDDILRRAFSSRRKTLANAMRGLAVDWDGCEIDPGRRPQTLSPREFVRLARCAREGG